MNDAAFVGLLSKADLTQNKRIHELFEEQAAQTPDAIAVEHEGAQLTYAELRAEANRLAHHLRGLGVGPESLVGLCVERSFAMVVGLLGILKAGGAYVPLDPAYPAARLAFMCADAGVSILVTQSHLEARVAGRGATLVRLDADASRWRSLPDASPDTGVMPSNAAYVIYTSGSTGEPKGVVVEHRSVVACLAGATASGRYAAPCKVLHRASLAFDVSVLELLGPLLAGGCVVMAPTDAGASPPVLAALIRRSGVTYADFPPVLLTYMLDEADFVGAEALRVVTVGGEALEPALAAKFLERCRAELWNEYGPTEATVNATSWPVSRYREVGAIRIGRPFPGYRVYVLETNGEQCPPGTAGELCIGGAGVARGYLGKDALTAERFVPDPFSSQNGARMYRTGDRARWTQDGELEFLGRIDHQIKFRGFRIELGEIEAVLSSHPSVRACVALAREDTRGESRLVAYVVPSDGDCDDAALRAHLRTRLPDYMIPSLFVLLDALPLSPSGKVDRAALPAPDRSESALSASYSPPRNPTETALCAIWAEVLGLPRVGIHDDFFALGGDSIRSIQVVNRSARAGLRLTAQELFERPTIAALSDIVRPIIEPAPSKQEPAAEARGEAGKLTPSDVPLAGVDQPTLDRICAAYPGLTDLYPATPMQAGMLFHVMEAPESASHFEQLFIELRVEVDEAAFESAFADVVARHPTLRTALVWRDVPQPLQAVISSVDVPWQRVDWQNEPIETENQRLTEWLAADRARNFALDKAPLMRMAWLRHAPNRRHFVWSSHHILSDGWSLPIILRDVVRLYEARRTGIPATLPEPPPYRRYIAWLLEQDREVGAAFWRDTLAGLTEPFRVGLPAPEALEPGQGSATFMLSSEATLALQRLARDNRLTQSTLLQGAWALLLWRYSNRDDVCFGVTVSGRPPAVEGVEQMVGLFINTIPLRARVRGDAPLIDWLRDLQANQARGREHQATSLADIQRLAEIPAGAALFDTLVVFENFPFDEELANSALGFALGDFTEIVETNYPIVLVAIPGDTLKLHITWDQSRFEAAAMETLLSHLQQLLLEMVADPSRRLSELEMMTAEERHQLLVEWNTTAELDPQDICIHELFQQQVERTPDAIALAFGSEQWTYRHLNSHANRLAHHLAARGVGPNVPVGLCVDRSPDMVVGLLGILKAGGAYVPLDPEHPRDRLALMLRDAGATILLTQSRLAEQLAAPGVQTLVLDSAGDVFLKESDVDPALVNSPEDLSYVIYTSGSTGQPKGVVVSHRNLVTSTLARLRVYREPARRLLLTSSFAFDITTGQIFWALCSGGALVLSPDAFHANPDGVTSLIAAQRVSHLLCVPSLYALLLDGARATETLSSLSTIILGGEIIPPSLVTEHYGRAPHAALFNEYGPTETTVWSSYHRIAETDSARRSVPIGRPIPGTQIYILNEAQKPAPVGVPGELCIGGAGVTGGYLNRPSLTQQRFIKAPFSTDPSATLYRTGDLARFLPGGVIEFVGRIDHQVKLRGHRIELGEIEAIAAAHPGVRSSAAIVREDTPGDQRLVLYVVRGAGAALAEPQDLGSEQVSAWRTFFDEAPLDAGDAGNAGDASGAVNRADPAFNIEGWNSSYTKQPIPADQMREWRDHTVERIVELAPSRVWEIGCGSGLILLPLAPRCDEYLGTDFSVAGIEGLRAIVESQGLRNVRLEQREAADCEGVPERHFDVIIINSVVQYFPSADYLRRVLVGAARALAPGGAIFLGDIRNHDLLNAFHASVLRHRRGRDLGAADASDLRRASADEEELLVAPAYLRWLCAQIEGLSRVEVYLKRGHGDNEMNRYRYDAILYSSPTAPVKIEQRATWSDVGGSADGLSGWLQRERPKTAEVLGIPNERVHKDVMAALRLLGRERQASEERRLEEGVDPESLWVLAERHGYRVRVRWSEEHGKGAMDALWELASSDSASMQWPSSAPPRGFVANDHVSDPLRGAQERELASRLKSALEQRVPDYMVPSAVVVLDAFPLTRNGKIDRSALPAPEGQPVISRDYVAPGTQLERSIADIFAKVLRLPRAGLHDDFFALGGHSLLAVQVISRLRDVLGLDVPVGRLFASPTVADLARVLESDSARFTAAPVVTVARGADTRFPLSFAQERIWRLEQRSDWTAVFNMGIALKLVGPLDRPAFAAALSDLVERHETLRTAIACEDGVLHQHILPAHRVPILWEDLSHLDPASLRAELRSRYAIESERRFSDPTEPLCCIRLLALGHNESALIMTIHHTVTDGWSMSILMTELGEAYRSRVAGRAPSLPPLPLQLADYASWERARLSGDVLDRLLTYWREKLHGAPTLALPTDHPRPSVLSDRGGIVRIKLSPALSAQLEALAQSNGATLFVVLLATWQLLLCHYAGQSDIVVGTLVANRSHPGVGGIIGCFINLLALRTDLSGDPTFIELLRRAKSTAIAAFEHEAAPIELVIDALGIARDPSRRPLFQTMVVLQNAPSAEHRIADDIHSEPLEAGPDEVSRFELMLSLTQTDAGLRGILRYGKELYDSATVERVSRDLVALLEQIVATPKSALSALTRGVGPLSRNGDQNA